MSIIEQIKAEIERQQKENVNYDENGGFASYCDFSAWSALDSMLTFVSGLEETEKPKQDGLEEEIQRFLSNATKMDKGEWKGKYPISEMGFGVVARHFAQWGAEHLKK
jgi:hypothetical protein